jgi:hypothetical protein
MTPERSSRGEGEDSKKRKMRSFGAPAAEILRLDFSKLGNPAAAPREECTEDFDLILDGRGNWHFGTINDSSVLPLNKLT